MREARTRMSHPTDTGKALEMIRIIGSMTSSPHWSGERARTLLLVHPPQHGLLEGFTAGLVSLANYTATHAPEIEVRLLDLGLETVSGVKERLELALRETDAPHWVGISTTTATYQSALTVARIARAIDPSVRIVLGGHHVNAQDDVVLRHHVGTVDVVARGEAERSLVRVVRGEDAETIPGISFLRDGRLQRNPPADLLEPSELDEIPVSFHGGGIRSAPGKFDHATYVSARGCPLGCHFCAVARQKVRAKTVEAVIRDLRELVHGWGFREIAIEDNFFAQSRQRTLAIAEGIRASGLEFSWDCQTRVESCSPEIVRALKGASCEAVYLGVEALNPEQLGYLGKTSKPDRYLRQLRDQVVPDLVRHGLGAYLNLQIGLPEEGADVVRRTVAELAHLGTIARAHGHQVTVFPQLHVLYPGTQHFMIGLEKRWFGPLHTEVFEHFTEWESHQEPVLRWLGRHFAHGTGGIPLGILDRRALEQGTFRVEPDRIFHVSDYLSRLEEIDGVRVFRYGKYLADADASVASTSMTA